MDRNGVANVGEGRKTKRWREGNEIRKKKERRDWETNKYTETEKERGRQIEVSALDAIYIECVSQNVILFRCEHRYIQ